MLLQVCPRAGLAGISNLERGPDQDRAKTIIHGLQYGVPWHPSVAVSPCNRVQPRFLLSTWASTAAAAAATAAKELHQQ